MDNSTTNFQQPQQELSFTQPFAHPDKRNAHNFYTKKNGEHPEKIFTILDTQFCTLEFLWFKVELNNLTLNNKNMNRTFLLKIMSVPKLLL